MAEQFEPGDFIQVKRADAPKKAWRNALYSQLTMHYHVVVYASGSMAFIAIGSSEHEIRKVPVMQTEQATEAPQPAPVSPTS